MRDFLFFQKFEINLITLQELEINLITLQKLEINLITLQELEINLINYQMTDLFLGPRYFVFPRLIILSRKKSRVRDEVTKSYL